VTDLSPSAFSRHAPIFNSVVKRNAHHLFPAPQPPEKNREAGALETPTEMRDDGLGEAVNVHGVE
jgi:hypothetical protein